MGGTVVDFVSELEKSGDLDREQALFIKIRYPNEEQPYEPNQGKPRNDEQLDGEMIVYLDEQERRGKLSTETKQYVSTLLRLQSTPPLDTSHPVAADYTGNGAVDFLGRSKPSPFVMWSFFAYYKGIWGYATGDREYALVCHSNGLHIVDVTDPAAPLRVQYIPMRGGFHWRDVETYYHVSNGKTYAYVGAQSGPANSIYVVDLSALSGSTPHGEDDASCEFIDRGHKNWAHTVTVRDELLILNSAGYESLGCQIFDLKADPWDPPLLEKSYAGTLRDCHDSVARNGVNVPGLGERNLLYSADGSTGRYRIVDITGVQEGEIPEILGETEDVGVRIYAHSVALSEDSKYLYVFEESNTFDIGIFDVSDPSNITLLRTFSYSGDGEAKAFCHNGQVRGNYLFVAYYEVGLRVFDISDPTNPVEVGKHETHLDPDNTGRTITSDEVKGEFSGAWNVYTHLPSGNILVTDQLTGLHVVKLTK
jgi:choice-of-anchor B domain-containing protein